MVSDIQPEGTQASASTVTSDDTTPSLEVPSPAGPSLLDQYTAHYPDWAKDFARKYFTKTLTQFIIYGNVRDLVAAGGDDGKSEYVSLHEFLVDELFASRDIVLFYDRSSGIHFADKESQKDFNRALSGYDTIFGTDYAKKLPKDPVRVLAVLQNYFRLRLADGKRIACIIDYAETVIPMAEASMYSEGDRNALVFLQKWAHDPLFLSSDFTVTLITQNLSELNQQIVQSPYTAEIQIPIPDEEARRTYVDSYLEELQGEWAQHSEVEASALASNTAGLGFIQLQSIIADVIENRTALTYEVLSSMKKEFIEAEAYGMLEFMETDLSLDMVAGHSEAKAHLRDAAKALKAGRSDVMPMGYLVSGPVGTGKTFSIMCFAGEIGIPMVKLKNFRSQWQGQTEANLEKILTLLQAMTPVAVMIDEADAALGNRDAGGDSGVSKRVFGQIAQFMSNSKNRGRVIWFLVTARPDYMPVDLKRQGRAEEHIALFYPSTREEREELLTVMLKRTNVHVKMSEVPDALLNGERTFSGADMEALLTRAKFRAASDGRTKGKVNQRILQEVVDDFMPPTYPLEVELQTLVAVLECTSRSLLPEVYRTMDRETIVRRVDELSHLIK
ncbi:MAG: ATP-binding protein [Bacteroidetes Order II. Incertae sedis bacterium]|nr:ATP-binding protein [Bacteroidetes Order II. bacterium]MBT4052848.1 ATP-binding protein [Bacteroidetes Order II. bacterium]MBT4603583.1 ATP-binding protein [Bacteroidetes Order II. bacterium]MBT5250775.1 ATP-binding protein [Bacteroidetes Order II. bacterium]MBT6199084.1 ATP-binding protein [Bacteroidetes Order II. bacterium]